MTTQSVRREQPADPQPPTAVFRDAAESEFYARCVKDFLLREPPPWGWRRPLVELGSGTGEAIATVLTESRFPGEVHGYEIQPEAYRCASLLIDRAGVPGYRVFNEDFFAAAGAYAGGCAISNPPFLPAPDAAIRMPELWGGPDGSLVLRRLLDGGFERLVTTMPSFSNPLAVVDCAARRGYRVADFAVRTVRFGPYSSEPKVRAQIARLGEGPARRAFVRGTRYCLAGVLWARSAEVDLTPALRTAITSLHS